MGTSQQTTEVSVPVVVTSKTPLVQAKELLDAIKSKSRDSEEFKKLDELLGQVKMDNETNKQELFLLIDTAIKNEENSMFGRDKKDLMKLKNKWFKDYEKAEQENGEQKGVIRRKTKQETTELADNNNRFDLLANLDGDHVIDDAARDFVSEIDLKKALFRTSNGGENLDAVYNRMVGGNPDWKSPAETVKKFHTALRVSIDVIRQLTDGGNAGLYPLLMGKIDVFVKNVQDKVKANNNKPLEIKIEKDSDLSPMTHNIVGALATAGILIVTDGVVMAGHEKQNVTAERLMEEIQKEQNGTFGDKTLSVLTWIKEAFMGRKLSITWGEEKVKEYKEKILKHAKGVMELTPDTQSDTIENIELKTAFDTAMRTMGEAGIDYKKDPEAFKKIQKALIQSYIVGEGFKIQGSSWSGSIGLLMLIGVHRDEVAVNSQKTEPSEYNTIERKITERKINSQELKKAGVKEKQNGQNWVYMIPTKIQFSGDHKAHSVTVPDDTTEMDTKTDSYIFTFDSRKTPHFSDTGDGYVLTFTESDSQSQAPSSTESKNQEGEDVQEIERETDKNIQDMLYFMGHSKEPQFRKLVGALSRQDFESVSSQLEGMKKGKYKGLANKLLGDMKHVESWTTYMYGTSDSRARQKYTQKYIDKHVRTSGSIRAEQRLAKSLGITTKIDEKLLKNDSKKQYINQQASDIYPEQAMTISCFATPKGGLHRLDTFDGSVMMSNNKKDITDSVYKKQIIKAIAGNTTESKGIHHQVTKLNEFLSANKPGTTVTPEQYKNYLVSGNIADLGVEGLQVQKGKETKIFEGRAMIAGNVCLNRLLGIVYPRFSLPGVVQPLDIVSTVDHTAPLNDADVGMTQDALGLNLFGVVGKLINEKEVVVEGPKSGSNPGRDGGAGANPVGGPVGNLGEG